MGGWHAGRGLFSQLPPNTVACRDRDGRFVLLFEGDWEVRYATERVPGLLLETLA